MSSTERRQTRSQSKNQDAADDAARSKAQEHPAAAAGVAAVTGATASFSLTAPPRPAIKTLVPSRLTPSNAHLSAPNLKLLLAKREKLRAPDTQLRAIATAPSTSGQRRPPRLASALRAAFVFGQEEAGTAVCISPSGVLLTCSHCVLGPGGDEVDGEGALGSEQWLVGAEGRLVRARCTAWDARRDLALLQIVAAEADRADVDDGDGNRGGEGGVEGSNEAAWPYARLAQAVVRMSARLVCVGHPGSEDLEATVPGQATGYDVLHVSEGRYRGLEVGQDVHDNSEIGALKHDCWTYWGHSGAPLLDTATGDLVGLHSSWDDQTGMRRGIALEAVVAFLRINGLGDLVHGDQPLDLVAEVRHGSRGTPIVID